MTTPEPPRVWYAAYGSNICEERFMAYIVGGRCNLVPDRNRLFDGCGPDRTDPPAARRPYVFEGRHVYFTRGAASWSLTDLPHEKSAVAFLSRKQVVEEEAYGAIYNITLEQFVDVMLQENDLDRDTPLRSAITDRLISLDVEECFSIHDLSEDPRDTSQCYYGLVMRLADTEDGGPVYTFTEPQRTPPRQGADGSEYRAPSTAYIGTIVRGLIETRPDGVLRITADGRKYRIGDYLAAATAGTWYQPLICRMAKQARARLERQKFGLTEEGAAGGDVHFATVGRTGGELASIREPVIQILDESVGWWWQRNRSDGRPRQKPEDVAVPRPGFFRRLWMQISTLHLRYYERVVVTNADDESTGIPQAPGVLAFIERVPTSDELKDGEAGADMKIRVALSLPVGSRMRIERWSPYRHGLLAALRSWGRMLLERVLQSQATLVRVEVATFEDMEINVARLPPEIFAILGVDEGEQILIESPTGHAVVRALPISSQCAKDREQRRGDPRFGVYVNARTFLGIGRLLDAKAEGSDIPAMFIDKAMRDKLGLLPTDAVRISRHASSALTTRVLVFVIPIAFTLSTAIHASVSDLLDKGYSAGRVQGLVGLIIVFLALLMAGVTLDLRKKVN